LQRSLDEHFNEVGALVFSSTGDTLVSASIDSTIKRWQVRTGRPLLTRNENIYELWSVAISPDGASVAGGDILASVQVWDATTGKWQWQQAGHRGLAKRNDGLVNCVAFSPDGQMVASGGDDATVQVRETRTGKLLRTLAGHSSWVNCVAFSPDGKSVAAGSENGTVLRWNIVATEPPSMLLTGHEGGVNALCFSPDGKTLATGGDDNAAHVSTIKLWDVATGQPLATLTGHRGRITTVVFWDSGKIMATGSADGTVKLWDAHERQLLVTLQALRANKKPGGYITTEWIAYTSEGYYNGSAGAAKYIRWRVGDRLYAAAQFEKQFHRPDLVRKALSGG
jgi:WD40 repeat protein